MLRKTGLVAAVLVSLGLTAPAAMADPTPVTVDNAAPTLTDKGDDGWTAALGFTNLTDQPITLEPKASADNSCALSLDKPTLPAGQHQAVTLTIPPACDVKDEGGFDFQVGTAAGTEPSASFDMTAAPKPSEDPNWDALLAFPLAFLLALIISSAVVGSWSRQNAENNLGTDLKYLPKDWSFSDSWVTNVTAAGAVLTAVFASTDVVTALLGEDAKDSMALATVGAAVALGFTGAGPVVLGASRRVATGFVPVGGLMVAAAVTVGGALGELWVLWESARHLDLGGHEDAVAYSTAIPAAALLFWYLVSSLLGLLTSGTTPPPPAQVTRDAVASALAEGGVAELAYSRPARRAALL
jgi:hypothetical protein